MFWGQSPAIFCLLLIVHIVGVFAYPMLNLPYLFGPVIEGKHKKNDLGFPELQFTAADTTDDGDVLELENLKHNHDDPEKSTTSQTNDNNSDNTQRTASEHFNVHVEYPPEPLPDLQREVETLPTIVQSTVPTTMATTTTAVPRENAAVGGGVHHPPTLSQNEQKSGQQQTQQQHEIITSDSGLAVPSITKPFYGAARLAFGQNPEVLPTSSTTSTTTSTVPTTPYIDVSTTTTASSTNSNSVIATITALSTLSTAVNNEFSQSERKNDFSESIITVPELQSVANEEQLGNATTTKPSSQKETIGSIVVDDLETVKTAVRRSLKQISPKTAHSLLHHQDGQFSSFDMAQYIFWTGDESGVAHAIEECIAQGLITQENALKLLREIRLGIEYLQRSYENRVLPEQIHQNSIKKSYPPPTTTTTTTTTTVETPLPYVERVLLSADNNNNGQLSKTLDSIALWNKLQELNNDGRQDLGEYDEAAGRAKIAEFLYTHYTVEEILYKLAKVMFTQSLAHGSDEAQRELQKLTDFLEREGNLGVIPIDLQKKVLHVLLTALSDTLTEHPELLTAAHQNLINPYDRNQLHAYAAIN